MDIAKLQRVNQLARDLKSFGMVETMDEAYSQADSYIDGHSELDFLKRGQEQNTEKTVSPQPTAAKIEQQAPNATAPVLGDWEQKFIHLSSLYREQEARLSNMADIIMKMQHAMNDIISEQNKLKTRSPSHDGFITSQKRTVTIESAHDGEVVDVSEAPARPAIEPKAEAKNNNPRCGDIKPEDVSIDKMFYFGNKR